MNEPLTPTDEQLTRWIDGALTPEEAAALEQRLASDARWAEQMAQEKDNADVIGSLLRSHVPLAIEPHSAEFFRRQVLRQIESELAPAPVRGAVPVTAAGEPSGWFARWIRPLIAPVGLAGAAAAAVALIMRPSGTEKMSGSLAEAGASQTRVISAWSPETQSAPQSYFSTEAGAQVIDVQGLAEFPAERTVAGLSNEREGQVAVLTP